MQLIYNSSKSPYTRLYFGEERWKLSIISYESFTITINIIVPQIFYVVEVMLRLHVSIPKFHLHESDRLHLFQMKNKPRK